MSTRCPKVPGQFHVYTLASPSADSLHRFVLEHETSEQVEMYIWKPVKGERPAPARSLICLWSPPELSAHRGRKEVVLGRRLGLLPGVRTPGPIPIPLTCDSSDKLAKAPECSLSWSWRVTAPFEEPTLKSYSTGKIEALNHDPKP